MEQFTSEIERYVATIGIADSSFGPAIGRTRTFVYSLKKGHRPSLETADRARAFIRQHPTREDFDRFRKEYPTPAAVNAYHAAVAA